MCESFMSRTEEIESGLPSNGLFLVPLVVLGLPVITIKQKPSERMAMRRGRRCKRLLP